MVDSFRKVAPMTCSSFRFNGCHKSPSLPKRMKQDIDFKLERHPPLTFQASFEDRGSSPLDQTMFRDCNIQFFLEDGTIKVFEPMQKNSGIVQGNLINRMKIPKPEGGFYMLEHLNVGNTVVFYEKKFKIFDCDPFTRKRMTEMGYRVGDSEAKVVDPVYADRLQEDRPKVSARKPFVKSKKGLLFLKNFPKTLHFYGLYERNPSLSGEKLFISLYYSLADRTIQIVDESSRLEQKLINLNLSNHRVSNVLTPVILKPTMVPKRNQPMGMIGHNRGRPVLNLAVKPLTLRGILQPRSAENQTYIMDSNSTEEDSTSDDYYSAKDLDLGVTIWIYGSKIYLYDCDEFTKKYYQRVFCHEMKPVQLPEETVSKYHKLVAPNEIGDSDDTLRTCRYTASTVAGKNKGTSECAMTKLGQHSRLLKFFLNCRDGLDGKVLRFLARSLSKNFVKDWCIYRLEYFLEDDTISITEFNPNTTLELKNGTRYLSRMKVCKPDKNPTTANKCLYTIKDMFVGNVICMNMEPYYLFDADEYTYVYMEKHCDMFPFSNATKVLEEFVHILRTKAGDLTTSFETSDEKRTGSVSYDSFRGVILKNSFTNHSKPEQEFITLARMFADEKKVGMKREDIISRVQDQLKRNLFQDFSKLRSQFKQFDYNFGGRSGRMIPLEVYRILVSCPLPVNRDLLKSFVYTLPMFEGLVDYEMVLGYLDYVTKPVKSPDLTPYAINLNWERVETVKNMDKINYVSFLTAFK